MTNKERLILGGLGALIPSACNLLLVDFHNVVLQMDMVGLLGYAIRVLILFALGAFLAYVHKDEVNAWKVVQLGLGVPALAISILNAGNSVHGPTKVTAIESALYSTVASLSPISEAAAQEAPSTDLKSLTLKEQSSLSRLFHGFTGTPRKHVWFVIADTAPTADEARKKAAQINQQLSNIRAEVYRPDQSDQAYPVVVGRDLELQDAQELVEKLNKATGNIKARVWSPLESK